MPTKLTYINKYGQHIKLTISEHARQRFVQRWPRIFPDKPISKDNVDDKIVKWFSCASRVIKLSYQERKRLIKYGKDVLFFRANAFTFVVQNATIVTIEISDKGQRYLNNQPPWLPPPSRSNTDI